MEDRTLLATMLWAIPVSGDWDVASNWINSASSDHHVPTSADDAEIIFPGITVTHASSVSDTAHSLTSHSTVKISGGSLTLGANSTITDLSVSSGATLILNSLTLSGTGTLTNAGTLDLTSDTINAPLVNQGTILVQASSTIAGSFSNAGRATLQLHGNGLGDAALYVTSGLSNAGTIDLTTVYGGYGEELTVSGGALVN
ncbi:MAG: hypothetical protein ACHQ01_06540, partial [Candidatus Limnocylindrales bacterium]